MRASALTLVLATALLAGCGGSGSPTQTTTPNGAESQPPARVLADAVEAATKASSLHVSGQVRSGGTAVTFDLTLARGKGAAGKMATSGYEFRLVRIGKTFYIQGSDAFYEQFGGKAAARLLHGRWISAPTTMSQLKPVVPLTSATALFAEVRKSHGKLVSKGLTTYAGERVVEIEDTSDGSRLYVSAEGTPYPVAIVGGRKHQNGTISFDRWNQPVSISAPQGAIDLSKLGLG